MRIFLLWRSFELDINGIKRFFDVVVTYAVHRCIRIHQLEFLIELQMFRENASLHSLRVVMDDFFQRIDDQVVVLDYVSFPGIWPRF